MTKIDLEYNAIIGLSRRLNINTFKLEYEEAQKLKMKFQERIMALWGLYQKSSIGKGMDMERLL